MSEDPYVYPGTDVLRNKLGLTSEQELDQAERWIVGQRISQGAPRGDFGLRHVSAIHRHLFQDIYEWAGQVRTVDIEKGGDRFQSRHYIETGIADIHERLERSNYLKGLSPEKFAKAAGVIIGDLNYAHPFREGNGRMQAEYLRQLADGAGHPVDLTKMDRAKWIEASRGAHRGDYDKLAAEILIATGADRDALDASRPKQKSFRALVERTRQYISERDRENDRERDSEDDFTRTR